MYNLFPNENSIHIYNDKPCDKIITSHYIKAAFHTKYFS